MGKPEIIVYGAHWCPDCRESKQFLGEHQIPYDWVDIEKDPDAKQFGKDEMTKLMHKDEQPKDENKGKSSIHGN